MFKKPTKKQLNRQKFSAAWMIKEERKIGGKPQRTVTALT